MDFVDKKEKLADLIEEYIEDPNKEEKLYSFLHEIEQDEDFRGKDLFENLFKELKEYLGELSRKELKQRVLLIRSYFD